MPSSKEQRRLVELRRSGFRVQGAAGNPRSSALPHSTEALCHTVVHRSADKGDSGAYPAGWPCFASRSEPPLLPVSKWGHPRHSTVSHTAVPYQDTKHRNKVDAGSRASSLTALTCPGVPLPHSHVLASPYRTHMSWRQRTGATSRWRRGAARWLSLFSLTTTTRVRMTPSDRPSQVRLSGSFVGYRGGKRIFSIRVRIQILVPVASSLYLASAPDGS